MSKIALVTATVFITEKLPNGSVIESEVGIEFDARSYEITKNKKIVFTLGNGHKVNSPIISYKAKAKK